MLMKLALSAQFFSKNIQISNFMEIRRMKAELFHANGRTDRHDKANGRFSQFCERALKRELLPTRSYYRK